MPRIALLVVSGTRVQITSTNSTLDELAAFAGGMSPVAKAPPHSR